jgi:hypothetical protein
VNDDGQYCCRPATKSLKGASNAMFLNDKRCRCRATANVWDGFFDSEPPQAKPDSWDIAGNLSTVPGSSGESLYKN